MDLFTFRCVFLSVSLLKLFYWSTWNVLVFVQASIESDTDDEAVEVQIVSDRYFNRDSLYFELVEPEQISYVYKIRPAKDFGSSLNHTLVEIELVLASPFDACSHIVNAREVRGNVALVERGSCSFMSKALIAEQAGAVAVLITDHDKQNDDNLIEMVSDGTSRYVTVPSFFLLGKDGHMIKQGLERLRLRSAVINIPINASLIADLPRQLPPWSLW